MVAIVGFNKEAGLTGKFRVRRGWFRKMVLQVEVRFDRVHGNTREYNVSRRWRDATAVDSVALFDVAPEALVMAHAELYR